MRTSDTRGGDPEALSIELLELSHQPLVCLAVESRKFRIFGSRTLEAGGEPCELEDLRPELWRPRYLPQFLDQSFHAQCMQAVLKFQESRDAERDVAVGGKPRE